MKVEVNVLGFVLNNTVSVDVKQHFHRTVRGTEKRRCDLV